MEIHLPTCHTNGLLTVYCIHYYLIPLISKLLTVLLHFVYVVLYVVVNAILPSFVKYY